MTAIGAYEDIDIWPGDIVVGMDIVYTHEDDEYDDTLKSDIRRPWFIVACWDRSDFRGMTRVFFVLGESGAGYAYWNYEDKNCKGYYPCAYRRVNER